MLRRCGRVRLSSKSNWRNSESSALTLPLRPSSGSVNSWEAVHCESNHNFASRMQAKLVAPVTADTLRAVTWSARHPPRLHVRTQPIEDPGSLLGLLPPKDSYVWLRHGDGLVGWGEVVRLKPTSISEAAEWWADLVAQVEVTAALDNPPAGAGLMAYGSFLFDPTNSAGRSSLIVPQTVIGRRNGHVWRTDIG